MKKIVFYMTCFFATCMAIASCEDNTDVSKKHQLTQDETDEIHRQDSIDSVRRNQINADLILEYKVDITISQTSYDGVKLPIETNKIAELFGISVEELNAGIAGKSGAPEVKGFAIEGTTHVDNSKQSNTNSPWGHWWNEKGEVFEWANGPSVFTEYDVETSSFSVGQYPKKLKDGQKIKVIEALKYNEKRVAIVITVTAKGLGEITATVVNTQNLTVDIPTKAKEEVLDSVKFDLTKTLSDLGIASMDEAKFLGVNKDGSYAQEPSTGTGYWYNAEGFTVEYGTNSLIYTKYGGVPTTDYIGIGQYPNRLEGGESITVKYGILANNKIEMLKITINVIRYTDPETPPTGTPENIEKDISFTKPWSDDYAIVEQNVKDVLRQAFKMTTYQIHKAIVSGDLKVYLQEVTSEKPQYTADVPGYWMDKGGKVCKWADGVVYCSLGNDYTKLYLYGGNHPGNAVAGDVVKTKMIITCNGGQVSFNITFSLTGK